VGAPVGVHFLWEQHDVSTGYVGSGTLGLMVALTVFLFLVTVVGTMGFALVSEENQDRELVLAVVVFGVGIYSGGLVLWIWFSFFIRLMSF
jgi:hypothetical protein